MNFIELNPNIIKPEFNTDEPWIRGKRIPLGKEIPCKGLFFRYTINEYFNTDRNEIVVTERFKVLKNMSCRNIDCVKCDVRWFSSDFDAAGDVEYMTINYPKYPSNFTIYKVTCENGPIDWETGLVEDWEWIFTEVKEK